MRDARINTIGEGANEVLKAFIALVGMRDVGEGFKSTLAGLKRPSRFVPTLWGFGRERLARLVQPPRVPVASPELQPAAQALGRRVARFAWAVERVLVRYREEILERQYVQERIADAAIALVTASCTLARLDRATSLRTASESDRAAANLYLRMAFRRFDRALSELGHNDDRQTTETADAVLEAWRHAR